jgi:hypothetical protein
VLAPLGAFFLLSGAVFFLLLDSQVFAPLHSPNFLKITGNLLNTSPTLVTLVWSSPCLADCVVSFHHRPQQIILPSYTSIQHACTSTFLIHNLQATFQISISPRSSTVNLVGLGLVRLSKSEKSHLTWKQGARSIRPGRCSPERATCAGTNKKLVSGFLCLSCEMFFSNVIDAPSSSFQAIAALRISLNWHLGGVRTEKQRVSIQADVGDFSAISAIWFTRIFE